MNEATHADIIRRVEKIEIDVAVLDTKSNRLHQDMKETRACLEAMRLETRETSDQALLIARKTQTLVVAVPAVLSVLYTLIQIMENVK